MKDFKTHLKEQAQSYGFGDLHANLEKVFYKHFPNSYMRFSSPCLGDKDSMFFLNFTLLYPGDYPNNISENDPMGHMFDIKRKGESLVLTKNRGRIMTNPKEGSYMAMDSVKVPFRKATGNDKKITLTFDKYLTKLKTKLLGLGSEVYGYDKINKKYFK